MFIAHNLTEMLKGLLEGCVLEIISRVILTATKLLAALLILGFTGCRGYSLHHFNSAGKEKPGKY